MELNKNLYDYTNVVITCVSPVHVGADKAGTVSMPYMLYVPTDDNDKIVIDKEKIKGLTKSIGGLYKGCQKEGMGKRSFSEFFKDRVICALCTESVSQFFTTLIKKLPLNDETMYKYTAEFILSLSSEEHGNLLSWARENIDLCISLSIYDFGDMEISDAMCETNNNVMAPVIPGNTLRHALRECLMNYVFSQVFPDANPHKELPYKTYCTFYSGGILTSQKGYIDIESKIKTRTDMPFLSILGSMMGNEDLRGLLKVEFAKPICREFDTGDRSGMSYLSEYFMTRHDSYEGLKSEDETKDLKAAVQMYYSLLALNPGTKLNWGITAECTSELEKSFLDLALNEFRRRGWIGGVGRAGYGQIQLEFDRELNPYPAFEFIAEKKDEIKNVIMGL